MPSENAAHAECFVNTGSVDESGSDGSDLPVLNLRILDDVAGLLQRGRIETHLGTIAANAAKLRSALQEVRALGGDVAALAEQAHTLIGSAGMMGFTRLSFVARRFEDAVRGGDGDVRDATGHLMAVLDATLLELHARGDAAGRTA